MYLSTRKYSRNFDNMLHPIKEVKKDKIPSLAPKKVDYSLEREADRIKNELIARDFFLGG
jgi:hypothetical protein